MKLLIVCQYFYPEQFRVSDVSFKLASMGHDITVLTGLPNYPAGDIFPGYAWEDIQKEQFDKNLGAFVENIQGVKVIRCRLFPRKKGKINLFRNYVSYLYHASKVAGKLTAKNGFAFDKVLVFQFSPVTMAIPGIIVKRKQGLPLFLYCFDLWPESIVSAGLPNHGPIYRCLLALSRMIYRKADSILISSRSFENYFTGKLKMHRPMTYLPIYAEDIFSNSDHVADREESMTEHTNLIFAGNIGEMQSMETIIRAAERIKDHPEIVIHIVGDGSALDKSIALTKELSLNNIVFHGRHPLEDMPKYYQMADAFIVTLKKDPIISYTLPGKVQSYMAYGKPILAAIDGEAADTIRDAGCGLCCAAEDDKSLADSILQFAENKSSHRMYGDCSKSYYNAHFSEEAFFDSLLEVLDPTFSKPLDPRS